MIYFTLPFNPPDGSNGCANACFIRIRKGYENDAGLISHERCHVGQFWDSPLTHGIRYRFSPSYRLDCEVKAYRVQLSIPHPKYSVEARREMYATWLSAPGWKDGYNLQDICTKTQALQLLQ
jgi:hypothetical protein